MRAGPVVEEGNTLLPVGAGRRCCNRAVGAEERSGLAAGDEAGASGLHCKPAGPCKAAHNEEVAGAAEDTAGGTVAAAARDSPDDEESKAGAGACCPDTVGTRRQCLEEANDAGSRHHLE